MFLEVKLCMCPKIESTTMCHRMMKCWCTLTRNSFNVSGPFPSQRVVGIWGQSLLHQSHGRANNVPSLRIRGLMDLKANENSFEFGHYPFCLGWLSYNVTWVNKDEPSELSWALTWFCCGLLDTRCASWSRNTADILSWRRWPLNFSRSILNTWTHEHISWV